MTAAGVVFCVVLASPGLAAATPSGLRCEYRADTAEIRAVGTGLFSPVKIRRGSEANPNEIVMGVVRSTSRPPTSTFETVQCRAPDGSAATPTDTTTDSIYLTGGQSLVIDLSGGDLTPGATLAGEGNAPEIELYWESPGSYRTLDVDPGFPGTAETLHFGEIAGAAGANLNAGQETADDADVDVRVSATDLVVGAEGSTQNDVIDASGKPPFDAPLARRFIAWGGKGDDVLVAGTRASTLDGYDGYDTLIGSDQADELDGWGESDIVQANGGDDVVDAGAGTHSGDDVYEGGAGSDTIEYWGSDAPLRLSLAEEAPQVAGTLGVDTLSGFENLMGSPSPDLLIGSAGPNTIRGLAGNDRIEGLEGDDRLLGDQDSDRLVGGPGADALFGNGERDKLLADDGEADLTLNCGGPKKAERAIVDAHDPTPLKC